MPKGIIDSATVSQVVQCLDRGTKGQYVWSLKTVIGLTALLAKAEHLAIAPGLAPPSVAVRDDQDRLLHSMLSEGLVEYLPEADDKLKADAVTLSKQWIGRLTNIDAVKCEVESLLADTTNFQPWIDWAANKAWVAHSKRLDGLLDREFIDYVATIVGLSTADALYLYEQSKDSRVLERLARQRGDDFNLMTKAYVASSIIRGRYHEHLARSLGLQMRCHPLREVLSRTSTGKPAGTLIVSSGMRCVANLVLYGAVKQRKLEDRMKCWVESLCRIRRYLRPGGIQLIEGTGTAVVDAAFTVAQKAGVRVTSREYDEFIELLAGIGVGVLTSVYLSPWVGIPAGAAARWGLKKSGFPSRLKNAVAFHAHGDRLKDIAAGRIETGWLAHG